MDIEVKNEFDKLNTKMDVVIQSTNDERVAQAKKCGEESERIGVIEQELSNGEKHEASKHSSRMEGFTLGKLLVGIIGLLITLSQIWIVIRLKG